MDPELSRILLGSRLRLRSSGPYFSVLVSHLRVVQVPDDHDIDTAATDGRNLYISKPFWMALSPAERDFVLVHEVLHAALGHCWRRGGRDPYRWNIAADFVVNLIVDAAGYARPTHALYSRDYIKMTVEEIYAILPEDVQSWSIFLDGDVMDSPETDQRESARTWRCAVAKAKVAEKMYGKSALGALLDYQVEQSSIDWRSILWKSADARQDFGGFDRRLVHSELYVEDLVPCDGVEVPAICIDTSGSTFAVLGKFIAEVRAMAELTDQEFPLYYDDAALIGPLPLEELDRPIGGGGTSFVPFFEEVERQGYRRVVYLTDLCGTFPGSTSAEVLWVVPPGAGDEVPFGRIVRILD